jgi:hypothetical protein
MGGPSSSPPPRYPSGPLPTPDLGLAGRIRPVRESVDGAIKGAYGLGAADGASVGFTAGYAAGRVSGVVEGSAITAVTFGVVFFVAAVLIKAVRK